MAHKPDSEPAVVVGKAYDLSLWLLVPAVSSVRVENVEVTGECREARLAIPRGSDSREARTVALHRFRIRVLVGRAVRPGQPTIRFVVADDAAGLRIPLERAA